MRVVDYPCPMHAISKKCEKVGREGFLSPFLFSVVEKVVLQVSINPTANCQGWGKGGREWGGSGGGRGREGGEGGGRCVK